MKSTILMFVMVFISVVANAQLANTKWKGKVNIPNLTEVIFDFKTDTVNVFTTTGIPVESCTYSIKSNIITFKKTKGGSPCPVNSMFTIQYSLKDDKMNIVPLEDDCEGRKGTFTKEALVAIKN